MIRKNCLTQLLFAEHFGCALSLLVAMGWISSEAKTRGPLAELGLREIADVDRLTEFGCDDLLRVTKISKPAAEMLHEGQRLRKYEYRGIVFSTAIDEREVIQGVVAGPSAIKEWGIIEQAPASKDALIRKFGKPSRVEGDEYWYGSGRYETAIVMVTIIGGKVSKISWSCG